MKNNKFIHNIDKKHSEFIEEFENDEKTIIPKLINRRSQLKDHLKTHSKIDDIMNIKDEIDNINQEIKNIKPFLKLCIKNKMELFGIENQFFKYTLLRK